MKKAFTLIEIIVSVIIIAIVTLTLAKINKQNEKMVEYINLRNKNELSNTLFLSPEASKYNKSEKDAYTLLSRMNIKNSKTREYLKKLKRKIYTQDAISIEETAVQVKLNAIMLKSEFSTRYYRFEP